MNLDLIQFDNPDGTGGVAYPANTGGLSYRANLQARQRQVAEDVRQFGTLRQQRGSIERRDAHALASNQRFLEMQQRVTEQFRQEHLRDRQQQANTRLLSLHMPIQQQQNSLLRTVGAPPNPDLMSLEARRAFNIAEREAARDRRAHGLPPSMGNNSRSGYVPEHRRRH